MVSPFAWFDEARFGLFVHWGIYSLLGRGEQVLFREQLDPVWYRQLAARFKPGKFDAAEWMRMAREAGMKYAVLTAKHHDGFCLFDSAVSDFTSTKTAAGRDIVAEYVEACRDNGIRVGLYYSLADWQHPEYFSGPRKAPAAFDRFIDYTHAQVRELCTNYGKLDVLWFDGGWPWTAGDWRSSDLDQMIRQLQPNVMINDRLHGGGAGNVQPTEGYEAASEGYFRTAEQRAPGLPLGQPVETCRTSQSLWWGYAAGDTRWKGAKEVIHLLVEAAEAGANLLLNVGPKPDGSFPIPFVRILTECGRWMAENGGSIYGTSPGVCDCSTFGRMTVKGSKIYLHVLYWHGRELNVYGLANKVRSAHLLSAGDCYISRDNVYPIDLEPSQKGPCLSLCGLPPQMPDRYATVIVLEVEGEPERHPAAVQLWQEDAETDSLADWAAGEAAGL